MRGQHACLPSEVLPASLCRPALPFGFRMLIFPDPNRRGNLDLPHILPFFGNVQLEVLSIIAAFLLFVTQAWVCFHVKERVLLSSSYGTLYKCCKHSTHVFPDVLPKDLHKN